MDYLPDVIAAAKKAGEVLSSHFYSAFSHSVTTKSDQSPVTQADIAADKIIVKQLQKINSTIPILTEETAIPDFAVRQTWKTYWLVDPLDGTRGFIKRSPEFCINIALIENHEAIMGVIYAPISQACFYAIKNQGAFFIDPKNNIAHPIQTTKNNEGTLRFLTGYFDQVIQMQDRKKLLEKYLGSVSIQQMNSALKFPHIAQGLADIYVRFGATSEWDSAAGQCILCEAGGSVVDFQGNPLQYNAKSSLINPSFIAIGDVRLIEKCVALMKIIEAERSK
jgi:3'(2'), 5'-bisphosphate nucleotidase